MQTLNKMSLELRLSFAVSSVGVIDLYPQGFNLAVNLSPRRR
jgi:hypothetical protein